MESTATRSWLRRSVVLLIGLFLVAAGERFGRAGALLQVIGVVTCAVGGVKLLSGRSAFVRYAGGIALGIFFAGVVGVATETPAARADREARAAERARANAEATAAEATSPVESNKTPATPQHIEESRALKTPKVKPGLTMANYLRLETGMSYEQASEILGGAGEELTRVELGGVTTVMYSWKRWTGANTNATFQDGKLIAKAQLGLK
jgi:hypothetical protein